MVQSSQPEQHTIIALVEDKPGVLTRISSMFRRRGFNIESLAVGRSEKRGMSRMTFVVNGDLPTVQQVTRSSTSWSTLSRSPTSRRTRL